MANRSFFSLSRSSMSLAKRASSGLLRTRMTGRIRWAGSGTSILPNWLLSRRCRRQDLSILTSVENVTSLPTSLYYDNNTSDTPIHFSYVLPLSHQATGVPSTSVRFFTRTCGAPVSILATNELMSLYELRGETNNHAMEFIISFSIFFSSVKCYCIRYFRSYESRFGIIVRWSLHQTGSDGAEGP